jgi:hypothetical protein
MKVKKQLAVPLRTAEYQEKNFLSQQNYGYSLKATKAQRKRLKIQ